MNIQDAKLEIIHTIQAYTAKNDWGGYQIPALRQRPILLIGPPGIGKTAVMAQAAAVCGINFVSYTMTHHTRQSALGLPYIEHHEFGGHEYAVTEYTMSEIIASVYKSIEQSGCQEGLLFLDEINCVSETLAPAMLQFLQTKVFGNHRLPEGWILSAAGNPPEYNKSVRDFDIATLDRLKYITVEADYEAWRSYALESDLHSAILSWLDLHPDKFYLLKQSYKSRDFVTARGWEDLSCLLAEYEKLSLPVTADLIYQYLHEEELAHDFAAYYRLFRARSEKFPVAEMLRGSREALEQCRTFLDSAPFEECLQLMHLVLSFVRSHLNGYFAGSASAASFKNTLDQLKRYQKRMNYPKPEDALPGFLEQEREVLRIRQEHGLSPESEIEASRKLLYRLQQLTFEYLGSKDSVSPSLPAFHSLEDFLTDALQKKENALQLEAEKITGMTETAVSLFTDAKNSAGPALLTLLLSSLLKNPKMEFFLRQHPSNICAEALTRLDFTARENQIRSLLSPDPS